MKSIFSFLFDSHEAKNIKLSEDIRHKATYKFCVKYHLYSDNYKAWQPHEI
jgi:hypothetical protein